MCRKVDVNFEWLIVKPNMRVGDEAANDGDAEAVGSGASLQWVQDSQTPFSIEPTTGLLPAQQTATFVLAFAPAAVGSYDSVLHFMLKNIPVPRYSRTPSLHEAPTSTDDKFPSMSVNTTLQESPFSAEQSQSDDYIIEGFRLHTFDENAIRGIGIFHFLFVTLMTARFLYVHLHSSDSTRPNDLGN